MQQRRSKRCDWSYELCFPKHSQYSCHTNTNMPVRLYIFMLLCFTPKFMNPSELHIWDSFMHSPPFLYFHICFKTGSFTYPHRSQSLITILFIKPMSCTCSTLLSAPDDDDDSLSDIEEEELGSDFHCKHYTVKYVLCFVGGFKTSLSRVFSPPRSCSQCCFWNLRSFNNPKRNLNTKKSHRFNILGIF